MSMKGDRKIIHIFCSAATTRFNLQSIVGHSLFNTMIYKVSLDFDSLYCEVGAILQRKIGCPAIGR